MTKKHDKAKEAINRTDDLINDYLNDVISGNDYSETVPISEFFNDPLKGSATNASSSVQSDTYVLPVSIEDSCFLVPTIKLLASNAGNEGYSKEEALLILLSNLYFLRRPLSPKVRQCFLNLSEQVIDDYHFALWKVNTTCQGVLA